MGEERETEPDVGGGIGDVGGDGPQVAALRDATPSRQQTGQDGQRGRNDDGRQHEGGPHVGGHCRDHPGHEEGRQRKRGGQRSAQVVDHLPARDGGYRAPTPLTRGVARPTQDPRQQLPIPARPAMLAGRSLEVVGRELVEQLDVGHEARPGERALEQVMAEHRVLGHTASQRCLEGVDVVDALARVTSLAEQVLVDVRNGRGVRIDPG